MKNLTDKVAVITGAGSGIGRELARQLSEAGARVVLNDKNHAPLRETAESLGGPVHCEAFDVSDRAALEAFRDNVLEQFGQVDLVVNNAGFTLPPRAMEEISEADFRRVLEVNFWGVVHGTLTFLPELKKRPEAGLVNISSVFGLIGYPSQGPYSVSKFAVRGFTETLRVELNKTNITFTSVHPGGIKTNIVRHIEGMDGTSHDKFSKQFDKMARTTAAEAAAVIIRGIQDKKPRVLIGRDARFIDRIQRLWPSSYEQTIMKNFDIDRV